MHLSRQTREHLHGLTFDQIKSGILIIDPESHTILDVNPEAARMIGLPPAEIIGRVCHRFICPAEEGKCPITDLHQVVDNAERTLITGSMQEIPVLKTVHLCKVDNKEYLIDNFFDISALKANQEQVKKGENLLEQIYETSGVGMALLKPNATFFRVNSAFCRLTGYSQDELLAGKFTITHPDDLEESELILKKLSEQTSTSNITEKRYIKKNGETVHVIHHASVIHDVMGFPHLFIIQAEDITPLKKAMAKAEESDRLKTAFLHNLSHEVRTPANAIQGFSQLLNQPGLNQAEREQYFDIIKQSVTQLLDILNDTVEIAKLETNQVSLLVKEFNINTFLRNIYNKASKKFNRQIGHLSGFKLEIPEAAESLMVTSDEFLLEQCMMYLLSNAFKFSSHGEVIMGCVKESDDKLRLFVRDNGIGIAPDKLEAVFEKFRQVEETSTRNYGGLGLGLTLTRGLVTLLGGTVNIRSALGKGTEVSVIIKQNDMPLAQSVVDARAAEAAEPTSLRGKKILVAEDNDVNYEYLMFALRRLGVSMIRALNGLQAVEMCRDHPDVDLVLMDVQMPGLDGYTATRQIRTFRPDLPIIAQTAYSVDFTKEQALESGCNHYLSKPIELKHLISIVSGFINKSDKGGIQDQ